MIREFCRSPRVRPGTSLVLSTRNSTRYEWQTVHRNPALHDSLRRFLRDEQFGFRPQHSTTPQLAHLVERVSRNFEEKRLTSAVFLYVTRAFDAVWVDGFLYKLTILNFPSYLVKIISSYLKGRTFDASFQTATSTSRRMRAGVGQVGITLPVLFSQYGKDMPSRHVEVTMRTTRLS